MAMFTVRAKQQVGIGTQWVPAGYSCRMVTSNYGWSWPDVKVAIENDLGTDVGTGCLHTGNWDIIPM